MTTESRPISTYLDESCWLDNGTAWLWPVGIVDHTTAKGDRIYGVLVLSAAKDGVTLFVAPAQSTVSAREGIYPHPRESARSIIRIAFELAEAIVAGKPFSIGYTGTKDDAETVRRIDGAIPNKAGTSVYATDLDKRQARQFKIERVSWVGGPGS